ELKKLPGIGEKTAQKIVEYRNNYGGFKKIEDVMKVERIGPNLFEKIKDYIITK
ncbi:MAG: ComEA family DNA-binding protein, partial [Ignavibacteria bacterium]